MRSIPGTGLGLTISKLLTHIMGGELQVQQQLGAGSTFLVRLLLSDVRQEFAAAGRPTRDLRLRRAASAHPGGR